MNLAAAGALAEASPGLIPLHMEIIIIGEKQFQGKGQSAVRGQPSTSQRFSRGQSRGYVTAVDRKKL